MNKKLYQKAVELASRHYSYKTYEDTLTDGTVLYLVSIAEMPGCMGQAETQEEAIKEADNALIDFIYSLLEDGQEVPEPATTITGTGNYLIVDSLLAEMPNNIVETEKSGEKTFDDAIQPDGRELLFATSLKK